jgi:CRP-like cAMP-binding protein
LIETTRKLEPITFNPGEIIVMQNTAPDKFYIIKAGEVHVYLRQSDGSEVLVDTLRAGQFFGEMALLRGGVRTATVRADRQVGVEVVALGQDDFNSLISESAATRSEVDRVAQERQAMQDRLAGKGITDDETL